MKRTAMNSREHHFRTAVLFLLALFSVTTASACNTDFNVTLETFGDGVTVELRTGTPGNSRIVETVRSNGGNVHFNGLCPGAYFLAIGNDDNVSVTPVRQFQDNADYNSRITLQRGPGNVSKKSRKSL
jgi:hypothetical protein